jgi:acyl-CoA synthetase (NDP forming)
VDLTRSLDPLFAPRSVVVYGASDVHGSWGRAVAERLLLGEPARPVHFVSERRPEVLGRATVPSLDCLQEAPELAVLVVPSRVLPDVADQVLEAGVRAVVAIAAGFGETGEAGREIERRMAERAREAGAVLLGPNCMGVVDTGSGLHAAPWIDLPAGDVAFVSQSGNLSIDFGDRARDLALGFSRFVSVGNQADVTVSEVLADCVTHERTRVVAVYCEAFPDGRAFGRAVLALRQAGKPVVLLAPGRSAAGARAARSHTGALVGDSAVVDAMCAASGTVRVWTPREMAEAVAALRVLPRPRGRRVGVITTGGGNGVIASDAMVAAGVEMPVLPGATAEQIAAAVPQSASTENPVDLIGATLSDAGKLVTVTELLLDSGAVDAVAITGSPFSMWFDADESLAGLERDSVAGFRDVVDRTGRPVVFTTDRPSSPSVADAVAAGLVVHRDIESSARALRVAWDAACEPTGVPDEPAADAPVAGAGYWDAREIFAGLGVPVVPAELAGSAAEAVEAAARIGYPVVLKALAGEHKSEDGGVVVGIADEASLEHALAGTIERLAPHAWTVERMLDAGPTVELLLGCRRDPAFGCVAVAGAGGTQAEVAADTAVALAPVDPAPARRLIESLRCAPLLTGFRGAPPLAVDRAPDALAALSRFAAAHPEIAEIEINPLAVAAGGAWALDARIIIDQGGSHAGR